MGDGDPWRSSDGEYTSEEEEEEERRRRRRRERERKKAGAKTVAIGAGKGKDGSDQKDEAGREMTRMGRIVQH